MFLFDFKGGKVLHNDLNIVPLYLKEDLLQVEYSDGVLSSVIVDLGWYESEGGEGIFKIFVLINNDWDNPVEVMEFKTIVELRYLLDKAIELSLSLSKK
jgi:hypothetical protein